MIDVELTSAEVVTAAMVGVYRHVQALFAGYKPNAGFRDPDKAWHIHIEGACGEMAVAKAMKMFWSASVGTFKEGGDVGCLQVRTRSRIDYDLFVRPRDDPDSIFVLVIGNAPKFRVVGWIYGRDARQEKYLKDYGERSAPAWFVPQSDLYDMDCLSSVVTAGQTVEGATVGLDIAQPWSGRREGFRQNGGKF
jgi:hypothetical protein